MSVDDVKLIEYSDTDIKSGITPYKSSVISEIRTNAQICLTALDNHIGKRTEVAHGTVSSEASGFITPELVELLDSYTKQLDELELSLSDEDIPPYAIAVWNGEAYNVPTTWAICDGTRGTPDLRYKIPVNWGATHTIKSFDGSFTKTININKLSNTHKHSFSNCCYVCSNNDSPYLRYTKYGTVYSDNHWDWDNGILSYVENVGSAGSTSTTNTVTITVTPPYIVKWYIMKLPPTSTPEIEKFNISIVQPENGSILTNVSGEVTKGSRLSISVIPDDGYVVNGLYINDNPVDIDTIMYVYENITITADIVPSNKEE